MSVIKFRTGGCLSEMSIKINSFGGPIVWLLRKHYSGLTSKIMLKVISKKYSKNIDKFIKSFMAQEKPPIFHNVMIETINRCNGTCSFCPANKKDESRSYKKMPEEMFQKIIHELKDLKWNGKLFMCVNNEPLIDNRILRFCEYAKMNISKIVTVLITNGTLLSPGLMDEMPGKIDQMIINDYSEKYTLSKTHKHIYAYIKKNPKRFEKMSIVINRRYSKEILATRAGNAPNKPKKNVEMNCACLYPFTDLIIFPNGKIGMCCNDCSEITDFGDISKELLIDIWRNEKFKKVRISMMGGARTYPFCKECDVMDAGEREKYIVSLESTSI